MKITDERVETTGQEIAIIGLASRFPGAPNTNRFWRNLRDGVESIVSLSDEELRATGIAKALLDDPNYVKAAGILEGVELFDANLFGFNPREAELMDPQHRMFLECAWEALEDASYNPERFEGLIGVYAGTGLSRYFLFNLFSNREWLDEFQARLGSDKDFAPTRVSYKLSLKGPSLTIQSACSTSLVAVHVACQSLLGGECDIALAGGVTIRVPQKAGYYCQEGGIVSPDGHCRAFDAKAQGFVPGSGVGIVALKRLNDAIRDHDHIHAVIKGSAINNDGAQRIGYTAPSVEGQAEVIAEALAMAEVEPETVTYIETHGTGTNLGDPIEIRALTQAYRAKTEKTGFCAIGSVKTNIGHLDAAAGVAGLIKTVLALKHKQIPPSLHFQVSNPEINFSVTPFFVNTALTRWEPVNGPRRAGVSSFGLGGTNAHLILEEAPPREASGASRPWNLLALSAKSGSALERLTTDLAAYLVERQDLGASDVAYTMSIGRRALEKRRILVFQDVSDCARALTNCDPERVMTAELDGVQRSVAFMFPGGGAQRVEMGRELYQVEPVFRESVDRCAHLLKPQLGYDLRARLYPEQAETAASAFTATSLALPALFTTEYALAQLLMSWGFHPEALIGHSLGEYVAACLAGVFSLEDALSLVVMRGRLFEQLPSGAMLSVVMPEADAREELKGGLSLAAVNGPSQCVLSGPIELIKQAEGILQTKGVERRRLHIDVAAHSTLVESILPAFSQFVGKLLLKKPQLPFISNVTGNWITEAEATSPDYWARHLRQTVRFGDGVGKLFQNAGRILLEIGPGNTLSTLARQHQGRSASQIVLSSLRHTKDKGSDLAFLLETIGKLWLAGIDVDWSAYYSRESRQRIPLPTYPFEGQRYWIEPREQLNETALRGPSLRKKADPADWFYVPVWRESVPPHAVPIGAAPDPKTSWLVLMDECGIGSRLVKRLEDAGHTVTVVRAGDRFECNGDRVFSIDPRRREDYETIFDLLGPESRGLQRIVSLWPIYEPDSIPPDMTEVEQSQERCFFSLFRLVQALGERVLAPLLGSAEEGAVRIEIVVISNEMQDVTGLERLCPEKATLIGPCRVIPQEYPNLSCRSIDITLPAAGDESELIEHLYAELRAETSQRVIAYRGRRRWAQSFEPVRLERPDGLSPILRDRGVYLITGGLGGIGLELAEYLARAVQARLVLIGRSPLPAKEEWSEWLATHLETDPISAKIRKLQGIEAIGGEVLALSADVADEDQMKEVIATACRRFGRLNGVVHAAGVRPAGIIQQKEADKAAELLAPKVRGARLLAAACEAEDLELDFVILCSSLRAVVGGAGMVDHTGANAFLDAFAHSQSAARSRVISINWDSWGEVGQSLEPNGHAGPRPRPKARMTSAEGVEVFHRILFSSLPQVVVSVQDLQAVADYYDGRYTGEDHQPTDNQLVKPTHARPQLRNQYAAPRNEVERQLAQIWQELLGIVEVGIYDNFFELGGDSVVSIKIIARANQIGLRLTPRQIFENQTIARLAGVAGRAEVIEAEQGSVTGDVQIAPIQRWFFEQDRPAPERFTLATLFEAADALDRALLATAWQILQAHHDALRSRFVRDEARWRQFCAGPEQTSPLLSIDLSALSGTRQERAIFAAVKELQSSLDLTDGPIAQAAYFDLGPGRSSRLFIIIHHLVVDIQSWRILLGDLQAAYRQLKSGQTPQLPPKTASFRQWTERLATEARADDTIRELERWMAEGSRASVMPAVDYPNGVNSIASIRRLTVSLNERETRALLQQVPQVYQTETTDVLLTALAKACAQQTREPALLLSLEVDGRELGYEDLDLSRTTGWFTTLFPVCLKVGESQSEGDALKLIKEQLRSVMRKAHTYGLLRYLQGDEEIADQLRALPQPAVNFIYLGQIDQESDSSSLLGPVKNFGGSETAGTRSHLLQITASVTAGRLRTDWAYSENLYRRETIAALADEFMIALRALITHCLSPEAGGYTPSDFPEANLNQNELDDLLFEISGSVG